MNEDQKRLSGIAGRFPGRKIAVWGDLILDEYLLGDTRRISREAPVLILSYRSTEHFLGGGGNAVLNLSSLGAVPIPVGFLGDDEAGDRVRSILAANGVSTEGLITTDRFCTPKKTRVLAGEQNTRKQQILRIDREERVPEDPALLDRMAAVLKGTLERVDALLISDYNFFNVREDLFLGAITACRTRGIPSSLDSRFRLLKFPGTTVITPNVPEAEAALGLDFQENPGGIEEAGGLLLERSGAEAVVLTRGSQGMSLFTKKTPPLSIPIFGTTDIVDVTGAGDTVISVFTLALAAGADFPDAARLANFAGGRVVMKRGAAVTTVSEILEAIVT
jgi:rfaE bifunctional protein kinase chain/domain